MLMRVAFLWQTRSMTAHQWLLFFLVVHPGYFIAPTMRFALALINLSSGRATQRVFRQDRRYCMGHLATVSPELRQVQFKHRNPPGSARTKHLQNQSAN
jgi:hypothetical protein